MRIRNQDLYWIKKINNDIFDVTKGMQYYISNEERAKEIKDSGLAIVEKAKDIDFNIKII